jgi:PAS domain S-box-containing protein
LLNDLLDEHQFRVLVARDGMSGLEKAAYALPDLILLDVKLPDIDGFEVCRRLKRDKATRHIPIIFITAEASAIDQKLEGFAAGAVDYLTKPVQQQELLARVGVHLHLQVLSRSLQRQTVTLQQEIAERVQVEAELKGYQDRLEQLVAERTAALSQTNDQLRQEIAERTVVEQRLRQSEERLTLALQAGHLGIWTWDIASGHLHWSAEADHIFGLPPNGSEGSYQGFLERIHPDDRNELVVRLQDALDGTRPYLIEHRIVRNDGTVRWLESHGRVFHDSESHPTDMLGTVRDITERKEAELELQGAYDRLAKLNQELGQERNLLQTIFDSVGSGLALIDSNDVVIAANQPMATLLEEKASLIGLHWSDVAPQTSQLIQAAREVAAPAIERKLLYGVPGRQRTFDVSLLPVPQAGEPEMHILVHIVDVTEQVRLEALALQNERFAASGRLAASVAHEVNSPLQAIQNSLYILASADEPQRSRFLQLIGEEIRRIGLILRRLMDVQRADSDIPQPVDPHELLERVLLLTSGKLAHQRVRVERNFAPDLPLLHTRPDLLTQVLLNLVLNAIDAMPAGGTLRLSSTLVGSPDAPPRFLLAIADTGVGIAPEIAAQIFEPFFTTKATGTGIGLAVTRHLVDELGGAIAVESVLGSGSIFTLSLPCPPRRSIPRF